MSSFIENYSGIWKDKTGNRLAIKMIDDRHLSVTFTASGEDKPLCRSWLNDKPADGMIGSYYPENDSSIDVELSNQGTGFYLNLCLLLFPINHLNPDKGLHSFVLRSKHAKYFLRYFSFEISTDSPI